LDRRAIIVALQPLSASDKKNEIPSSNLSPDGLTASLSVTAGQLPPHHFITSHKATQSRNSM